MPENKNILLVVSGGIAACKCPRLIRILKLGGFGVRCILTRGGAEFVTALTLSALSGEKTCENLFPRTGEVSDDAAIEHIRLGRDADLIVVAPATANIIAKMATGIADDLATATLLAARSPIMIAPAMNVAMWENPATRANIRTLRERGVAMVGPTEGDMACGERGIGRMSEPEDIAAAIDVFLNGREKRTDRLRGRRALVTSGPTFEAIDPVRFIANRSSGKQGHAIAASLARRGAETILISGPTRQPDPDNVTVVHVETAIEMQEACELALPVDIAICAAAVSDWRAADPSPSKIKKDGKKPTKSLTLTENPDILASLGGAGEKRPCIVVGFAAETENVIENATAKLTAKGCDWIIANNVSRGSGAIGGDTNTVSLISKQGAEDWPEMAKSEVADRLAELIADTLEAKTPVNVT